MHNLRPTLNEQISVLLNNANYENLIRRFKRDLLDLAIQHERGEMPDAEYAAQREALGQQAEQVIYELWREVTANE